MQPSVMRDWPGATVVCVGGGPSFSVEQCERIQDWRMSGGCKVIVVNNAYERCVWADAHYFADHRWYRWHKDKPLFAQFRGERYSIENANSEIPDERIKVLKNLSVVGGTMGRLSTDPTGLYTGSGNGGYQAIELAVLKGAVCVVLIGYDLKPNAEGAHHWHDEYPVAMDGGIYRFWREEYGRMAPTAREMGIEILNASADTALEHFPRVSLESLVADSHATALQT